MNSAGDKKNFAEDDLSVAMAEDNPVRLWWGITSGHGRGEIFVLCGR